MGDEIQEGLPLFEEGPAMFAVILVALEINNYKYIPKDMIYHKTSYK